MQDVTARTDFSGKSSWTYIWYTDLSDSSRIRARRSMCQGGYSVSTVLNLRVTASSTKLLSFPRRRTSMISTKCFERADVCATFEILTILELMWVSEPSYFHYFSIE